MDMGTREASWLTKGSVSWAAGQECTFSDTGSGRQHTMWWIISYRWTRERPGRAPDMASVGVMDVKKSNPSQGAEVAVARQRVQTIWPWKRTSLFFCYLCQKVTVSSHSLLSWKSVQRTNEAKVRSQIEIFPGENVFKLCKYLRQNK